ncbi:MAG: hypothetical protein GY909_15475 [Oligoflexia bacterium]|nr:hypothetical protein [Oligoflexia bacterium]
MKGNLNKTRPAVVKIKAINPYRIAQNAFEALTFAMVAMVMCMTLSTGVHAEGFVEMMTDRNAVEFMKWVFRIATGIKVIEFLKNLIQGTVANLLTDAVIIVIGIVLSTQYDKILNAIVPTL